MRFCIFVIGTRAQLIKVAPVLRLAATSGLPHAVWLAGQHADSMDELLHDFAVTSTVVAPPERRERSTIGGLLGWLPGAFRRCRRYIRDTTAAEGVAPLVVVHGDTLSTLLGAAAARSARARVVHIESGLSSGRLFEPFPEEFVRRLTFRLLHYALCPNAAAHARMARYRPTESVDTGENTLLDCVRLALSRTTGVAASDYFVASIHRFENIYNRSALERVVGELEDLATLGTVHFVLHPPTRKRLQHFGLLERLDAAPGVQLEPRMPYTRFLGLLANARAVLSDGGSNQEELAWLGVPTVLYRDRSERPDGIGENACFRHDIDGSLRAFVEAGGLDALRRPRRIDDERQPSALANAALRRWAADTGTAP